MRASLSPDPSAALQWPPERLAWTIWGLGAVLYLVAFFQRVAPAVMTAELTASFGLTATTLGHLSALYFYSYVAMQIPTGILADRWGPRRLLAAGSLVCGAGTLLFALAPTVSWAGFGRFLIGGSVAVAYVSLLKLASHWFPARRYALLSGLALFVGIVGAVFAGIPLQAGVAAFGWRALMAGSALVVLAVGVAIWLVVRDDPGELGYRSHAPTAAARGGHVAVGEGIRTTLRYRNTWLLAVAPGGVVGAVTSFAGLWGVPFLTTHHGFGATGAAALCSATLVAWAVGGPLFGVLSDRVGQRRPLYLGGLAAVLAGWSAVIAAPALPGWLLAAILLATGFASGCMIIGFAFVRESVPSFVAGTASGIVNMGIMCGPMLMQPLIGWIMDLRWDGTLAEGARLYAFEAYRAGFLAMVVWLGVSLAAMFLTRETWCRPLAEG